MELRHLQYFLAVATQRSFTKAAALLCISQPPLSRQIKELEEEIGAQLFERSNKKVVLTQAGVYFEKECRQVLDTLKAATLKTRKISENINGEFRIGYISSTFSEDISKLLSHLSTLYPYVNFKLYEVPTQKQVQALELGKLDLGILRAPLYSPSLTSIVWFTDSYSLVYNKRLYPEVTEQNMALLTEAPFVFFNKEYAPEYFNALLEICAFYGFVPNIVHETNNVHSIIQLVRSGLGLSIVPSSIQHNHKDEQVAYIDLKRPNLRTEVLLATPSGRQSMITQAALDFLRQQK